MIKCAKRAINAILPQGTLSDEELCTAFTMAEGIINSRPISYVSNDINDLEPLTPGHFLRGSAFRALASLRDGDSWPVNRRWFKMQKIMDDFWRRFVKEITPNLNKRENNITE